MRKPVDLRLHGVKFEDAVKRMIAAPLIRKNALKKPRQKKDKRAPLV